MSGPGSKNPEPDDDVPVTMTLTELCPAATLEGDAEEGAAGGGAINLMTRVPHELVALAYSCTVHMVISSVGSTTVCEKSPQRCGFVTVTSYAATPTWATVGACVVPSVSPDSLPATEIPVKVVD